MVKTNQPEREPTPEQAARMAELQQILTGFALASHALTLASRQMTDLLAQLVTWLNAAAKAGRENSK